ncbi:MAG: ribosomal protein [Candidatus Parcubacteria bacterium]|jgi:large subunit ribosomal protein L13
MQITQQDLNRTVYVKRDWLQGHIDRYHLDAEGMTIGRIATVVADHLLGKNKAHYMDFWNAGGFVVVTNIAKMIWTGNKGIQKKYHSYSGRKGHVKSVDLKTMFAKDPLKVLWFAVRGMLPKNKLRDSRMKMMKMFTGEMTKYQNLPLKEIK